MRPPLPNILALVTPQPGEAISDVDLQDMVKDLYDQLDIDDPKIDDPAYNPTQPNQLVTLNDVQMDLVNWAPPGGTADVLGQAGFPASYTPTQAGHIANKTYVDAAMPTTLSAIAGAGTTGVSTGDILQWKAGAWASAKPVDQPYVLAGILSNSHYKGLISDDATLSGLDYTALPSMPTTPPGNTKGFYWFIDKDSPLPTRDGMSGQAHTGDVLFSTGSSYSLVAQPGLSRATADSLYQIPLAKMGTTYPANKSLAYDLPDDMGLFTPATAIPSFSAASFATALAGGVSHVASKKKLSDMTLASRGSTAVSYYGTPGNRIRTDAGGNWAPTYRASMYFDSAWDGSSFGTHPELAGGEGIVWHNASGTLRAKGRYNFLMRTHLFFATFPAKGVEQTANRDFYPGNPYAQNGRVWNLQVRPSENAIYGHRYMTMDRIARKMIGPPLQLPKVTSLPSTITPPITRAKLNAALPTIAVGSMFRSVQMKSGRPSYHIYIKTSATGWHEMVP